MIRPAGLPDMEHPNSTCESLADVQALGLKRRDEATAFRKEGALWAGSLKQAPAP
jgi:hypothetical protein